MRASTRRKFLKSTGATSVVGLAGCLGDDEGDGDDDGDTGTEDDTEPDDEPVELSATGLWSGGEQESFLEVTKLVEEETGFEIEYEPRSDDALRQDTLLDYQSSEATADIVIMTWPGRIASDANQGHLATMDDVWDPENFSVAPGQVSVDGNVYAAPFKLDLKPGLWYRKSFFEEHGLSAPTTYDEFLSLLEEVSTIDGVDAPLASGNGDGWPLSDLTEAFLLRQENGDQLQLDLASGDTDFDDPRVKTAFEELQELHQNGYFSQLRDFSVQYEYMWDGSTPIYYMGSWTPAMEAVKDATDLGIFRLPGTEGVVASINWLTIPKYSDNLENAKTAVSEYTSAEAQQIWVERGGFIASNVNVPDDAYQLEVMADLASIAEEVTTVPDLDDILGDPFQSEFWSQLKGFWAEPDKDIDPILSALVEAQQESLEE